MAYDPQRNRARARPAADEAAPVDLVLGGTIEPERAVLGGTIEPERAVLGGTIEPERAVLGGTMEPERAVHDCVHERGPDLRLIAAAGVAAVAAVAFALRRRAARR
ncbi:MAG: hypothetical protein F2812_10665 [Actinobacteria bacterium]|uniref:Unannotated protein n=1 Tax=freshwater metagenome TaxID=449393 RepID=A0A6J7HS32_9ZZZZ|nr:hypothetical protein [Actinomycetota bacterium]